MNMNKLFIKKTKLEDIDHLRFADVFSIFAEDNVQADTRSHVSGWYLDDYLAGFKKGFLDSKDTAIRYAKIDRIVDELWIFLDTVLSDLLSDYLKRHNIEISQDRFNSIIDKWTFEKYASIPEF